MVDFIPFKCESWPVRCSAGFAGRAFPLFGSLDEASDPFTLDFTWRKRISLRDMGWRRAAKRGCTRRKLKMKTEREGAFQIERKKQGRLLKGVPLQYEIYLSRRGWQQDQPVCPPVRHHDGCKTCWMLPTMELVFFSHGSTVGSRVFNCVRHQTFSLSRLKHFAYSE